MNPSSPAGVQRPICAHGDAHSNGSVDGEPRRAAPSVVPPGSITKQGLLLYKVGNKSWKLRFIVFQGADLLHYDVDTNHRPVMTAICGRTPLDCTKLLVNVVKYKFIVVQNEDSSTEAGVTSGGPIPAGMPTTAAAGAYAVREPHAFRSECQETMSAWIECISEYQAQSQLRAGQSAADIRPHVYKTLSKKRKTNLKLAFGAMAGLKFHATTPTAESDALNAMLARQTLKGEHQDGTAALLALLDSLSDAVAAVWSPSSRASTQTDSDATLVQRQALAAGHCLSQLILQTDKTHHSAVRLLERTQDSADLVHVFEKLHEHVACIAAVVDTLLLHSNYLTATDRPVGQIECLAEHMYGLRQCVQQISSVVLTLSDEDVGSGRSESPPLRRLSMEGVCPTGEEGVKEEEKYEEEEEDELGVYSIVSATAGPLFPLSPCHPAAEKPALESRRLGDTITYIPVSPAPEHDAGSHGTDDGFYAVVKPVLARRISVDPAQGGPWHSLPAPHLGEPGVSMEAGQQLGSLSTDSKDATADLRSISSRGSSSRDQTRPVSTAGSSRVPWVPPRRRVFSDSFREKGNGPPRADRVSALFPQPTPAAYSYTYPQLDTDTQLGDHIVAMNLPSTMDLDHALDELLFLHNTALTTSAAAEERTRVRALNLMQDDDDDSLFGSPRREWSANQLSVDLAEQLFTPLYSDSIDREGSWSTTSAADRAASFSLPAASLEGVDQLSDALADLYRQCGFLDSVAEKIRWLVEMGFTAPQVEKALALNSQDFTASSCALLMGQVPPGQPSMPLSEPADATVAADPVVVTPPALPPRGISSLLQAPEQILAGPLMDSKLLSPSPTASDDPPPELLCALELTDGAETGVRLVRSGTLSALFSWLLSDYNDDPEYLAVFVLCLPTFSCKDDIMQLLVAHHTSCLQRWRAAVQAATKPKATDVRIHKRTGSVLAQILPGLWRQMTESDLQCVQSIVTDLLLIGHLGTAQLIRQAILETREAAISAAANRPPSLPERSCPPGGLSLFAALPLCSQPVNLQEKTLLDFSSGVIARELVLMDAKLFFAIEPGELLAWSKVQSKEDSPHIFAMIHRFNAISAWCATLILRQTTLRARAKMLQKMVDITKALRKLHCFNGIMALLSGMNSAAVRRLQHTFEAVGARTRASLEKLNELMSHRKSFATYRVTLESVSLPSIPYLGLYLTDITFVHQGNKDNVPSPHNADVMFINFSKRRRLYKVCMAMAHFQAVPYTFRSMPQLLPYFGDFEHQKEAELFELSQMLEPRGSDIDQIA